jgi:hypothetical protein
MRLAVPVGMKRTVALVKIGLGGLLCRLAGQDRPAAFSEAARLRFDSEYDAILAEMAASLAPVSASRRTAADSR